jgi:molybdopterin-biosynthesis enzyme MoeA-like protein
MNIVVTWDVPETMQPKTQADIRRLNKESGIPLVSSLRMEGKTEAEIEQILKDVEDEQKRLGTLGESALRMFERQFGTFEEFE